MGFLIIKIKRSTLWWCLDDDMLSIYRPEAMRKIPLIIKFIGDFQPTLGVSWWIDKFSLRLFQIASVVSLITRPITAGLMR